MVLPLPTQAFICGVLTMTRARWQPHILALAHFRSLRVHRARLPPPLDRSRLLPRAPRRWPLRRLASPRKGRPRRSSLPFPKVYLPLRRPQESGKGFSLTLTLSTILFALSLLPRHSPGPSLIFLGVVGMVNLLGPTMLWWAWRWKTRRGGGWDVAVVKLRRRTGQG